MRFRFSVAAVAAIGLLAAACAGEPSTAPRSGPSFATVAAGASSYVLLATGTALPAGLAAKVSAAGGTLTASLDAAGMAVATSSDPDFATKAARINGLRSVTADPEVRWIPAEQVLDAGEAVDVSQDVAGGSDETFFNLQWAPQSIGAPQAWAAGYIGSGVRVAVIDGGMNVNHIDLAGSVDLAHSASFVPGFAYNQEVGTFSHATHVAGIIAARDNGVGTIGIAPGATIIAVKALHNGTGSFGQVMQAIYYAATPISAGGAGADIINMSLGGAFDRQGQGAAELAVAMGRATTYAYQQGVTVIASAGNDGYDFDHTNNLIDLPATAPHVIAIAATGPIGFAVGYPNGATNFSHPASYTNFGQSVVGFAAPGGDNALPGNALCSVPRIPSGSVTTACWVFDMVISPASINGSNSGYSFADGTSMAAPAAAGVAALIVGKHGGPMPPAQLEAALRASADDLGKPGNDDFYGLGFVNALRAVQ